MEILQFLLSFLGKELGGGRFKPIFEHLKNHNFDLKSAIKDVNFETLAPLLGALLGNFGNAENADESEGVQDERDEKNPTDNSVGNNAYNDSEYNSGLKPISYLADKEIIGALNAYFSD